MFVRVFEKCRNLSEKCDENCHFENPNSRSSMNKHTQQGFSLVELLIVVAIIGIIASIGIPLFSKAKYSAENTAALQMTRLMSQAQVSYFSRNSRYARLNELNNSAEGSFGTLSGANIQRGSFLYSMSPDFQTDADLRTGYEVIATRTLAADQLPYVIKINASGQIVQLTP
jgi:prepilin-type N-terminal cleavage/methylation domain-containing protein